MDMRLIPLLIFILSALAYADEPAAVNPAVLGAEARYEKELDAAQKQYDERCATARKALIASLTQILEAETKKGNLDAAIPIRERIKKLKEPQAKPVWISKDATYKVSSEDSRFPAKPGLLTGGGDSFGSFGFAFSTTKTAGAHIVIDLGKPKTVTGFYIENRTDCCQDRAVGMTVSFSTTTDFDRASWQADKEAREWNVDLKEPVKARYIRVGFTKEKSEYFHLHQMKIFGVPSKAESDRTDEER